jgi:hypothetical protein
MMNQHPSRKYIFKLNQLIFMVVNYLVDFVYHFWDDFWMVGVWIE